MSSILLLLLGLVGKVINCTRPFSDKLISFLYYVFKGKTKPLPPIQNKIFLLSATELAKKIRNRQIKCEDVMQLYIERAQAVQPIINAITDSRYEQALEEAKNIDIFLNQETKSSSDIERDTPLLGVPFTCKEVLGIKGLRQTAGCYKSKENVAVKDSDAAELYRKAGAIPVTVTNVPELCIWWDTKNLIFGATQNPYNHARIPGGSSGGEGALLAAAGAVIGLGTDVGGSIRLPSAFNGIYGHKPTKGIIPNGGYVAWHREENKKYEQFNTTGPMCRYPEDLNLLVKILSDNNQNLKLEEKVNFSSMKVYYIEEFPGFPVDTKIKNAVKKAAKYFEEKYKSHTTPINLEELKHGVGINMSKVLETDVPPIKSIMTGENGDANVWLELLKNMLWMSNHTLPIIFHSLIETRDKGQFYYEFLQHFKKLESKLQDIFSEDAILLVPTHPEPAPFCHFTLLKMTNLVYTALFNILGLPSTNIPAGTSDCVPFGIQAVSGQCKDRLTIAAAVELDKLFGGWRSPCPTSIT